MKIYKLILGIVLVSSLGACKKMDSLLDNPNSISPNQANVDLLLNQSQISFTGVYTSLSDYGAELTRQQVMFGPLYNNAYQPTSFDGVWDNAYTGVIKNINTLIPLALQQKKYKHAGMAQVLKAYTLGSMVDFFGDIPNSESILGVDNLNPKADAGATVYQTVIALLDSAISNFDKDGSVGPTDDLFYNGNYANWTTAAKTLKLKFLMQTRLVNPGVSAQIDQLISDGDLISSASQDFVFKYSTVNNAPDSRHPHYARNYNNASTGSNSVRDYIGTYFMWALAYEKSGGALSGLDPRRRFYLYRQRTNYADVNENSCPCAFQAAPPGHFPTGMPFCLPGSSGGYWGRDHGDNSGIPPDQSSRTTWGVYPAAGDFDASQGTSVNNTRGGKGAGIDPIWMSFFTNFMMAEAALEMGITTGGDARTLLEAGVRASIAKVVGFPSTVGVTVPTNLVPSNNAINTYVTTVMDAYDAAADDAERLSIIEKEYYLAAWGNGVEPYNNYRRTGYPDNLQLNATSATPGYFIRSLFYPAVYINRNLNAPAQKNPGVAADKVFWDNNPDNFVQ